MNKAKLALVLLLLPLWGLAAPAQIRLGLIGGANFARLSGGDADDAWSTRKVFGFGGIIQLHLSKAVTVQAQPMYLQQGTNDVNEPPRYTGHLALSYFNLPLLLKISLVNRSGLKPYVLFGPNLGLMLNAEFIDDNGEIDPLEDATKRLDFGINAGVGITLPVDKSAVFVEAQYGLGLTNVIANAQCYDDESAKIRSTKIMGGILFSLGK